MDGIAPRGFPSLDLYPLHDKDGFLEFVFGMWFHTLHIAGPPTVLEVAITFYEWPVERRQHLIEHLAKHRQVIP